MAGDYETLPSCQYCPPASPAEDGEQKLACCDAACIEVAAQRECDAESFANSFESLEEKPAKEPSSCGGGCCSGNNSASNNNKKAARLERLKAARERYAATLEAVGCICRALLARNLETCCSPQTKRTLRSATPRTSSSSSSLRVTAPSGCCSPKEPGSCNKRKTKIYTSGKNTDIGGGSKLAQGREDCCEKVSSSSLSKIGCCDNLEPPKLAVEKTALVKTGCCSGPSQSSESTTTDICGGNAQATDTCGSLNAPTSSKGGCCSDKSKDDLQVSPEIPGSFANTDSREKSCCNKTIDTPIVKAGCTKSCCTQKPGIPSQKKGCAKSCCDAKPFPAATKEGCCSGKSIPNAMKNKSSCSKEGNICGTDKPSCGMKSNGDEKADIAILVVGDETSEASFLDDCCKKVKATDEVQVVQGAPGAGDIDIEKAGLSTEHVTLGIEGMTCVGCENKLFRSLNTIAGITNLQTSLVMARAEFDLIANASIDDIIRELAKTTGFACQRLSTKGQTLDILVHGDARDFVNRKLPHGVEGMTAVDKNTVRVAYDAKLVGARDLVEKGFDGDISLAPARPYAELESGSKHVRETAFMTAFSTILTIPVLVLAWAPLKPREILYGSISLALATIVQFVVAGPFYPSAFKALLFTRVIEMDLLIVLSTSTAYIFSVVAFGYQVRGQPLSTGEFFETSTLLVTLIMVGRLVSAFARHKAVESISIRSLQSGTALLVDDEYPGGLEIDARLLQYGDVFKVLPDARIATDGTVISGASEVDESHITGEVVPVEKSTGSNIIAGCLNGSGTLIVRLRRLPGENTISEIATMVDEAKFSKPKIQELADRVASYFVPVVVVLTLITFAIWVAIGKAVRNQSGGTAVVQAITYAISVLIVSCPCAIGLAVPMVVVIAGGVGARFGVVFKSAETIEIARKVSHVVFDKTGTLTMGELSVVAEEYLVEPGNVSAAALVLGLTINSKHPVSAAVAAHLMAQGFEPAVVDEVRSVTGSGMEGIWKKSHLRVKGGNSRWLAVQDNQYVSTLLSQGRTVFCVVLGQELIAIYGLHDSLRPDAKSTIDELQIRGIAVSIVSGDDDGAVQRIGSELQIDPSRVKSRCSPGDKQKYIKNLMDGNKDTILFCGDGTNDAVALAQASIGLHMNSGTDVAQSAADAVLVRPALDGVLVLIDLSRAAFRRIIFNFTWSFIYNTIAVLLAAGAFVNARIPPEYAGLGEIVSVLPVILIALQLRWFKRN
ncbi:Cu2+-exporting ATPase [Rhexocercosporidium sp. MPI-PUGE-AT-0058]|nr:Cu2+-exporting ATPase [Rhexocercosporidium sp. MPI-PUGE-AT-0058]